MNLGIGFPEAISKTGRSEKLYSKTQSGDSRSRVSRQMLAFLVLAGAFGLLLYNAIRLQLISGPYYRVLSEQNRMRTKILHAPRGTIYDRDGNALVHNIPGYREKAKDCKGVNDCFRFLSRDEVLRRKAKGEELENLEIDSLRQYVSPNVFTHMLGYISPLTKEEFEDPSFRAKGYTIGDQVGRGGVEEQYEETLRGTSGKELIETDATGKELRVLGKVDPVAGKDITLAVDRKLEEVVYEAMKGKTGAVVVSDPRTGEIRTLLSMPSFDTNMFTLGDSFKPEKEEKNEEKEQEIVYKTVSEVLSDGTYRPLFNRAIAGTYPPGSTFKIITASAALEKGAIDANTQIEDTGILRIGEFSFANWYFTQYGKTEGALNIVGALRRSNDIFFYKVAEMTGINDLRAMGERFGLSKKLGIDLPGEASGLFPSDEWKKETFGEPWYIGDTYHIGIGQGFLLTTPLQMNVWTAAIANNGTICQPIVLKAEECKIRNEKFLKDETLDLIKEGLRQACDTGGTGWPLFKFKMKNEKVKIDERNFFPPQEGTESGLPAGRQGQVHIPVACKTGTAEFGDPKDRTHAWFTAYAPIADPELVVTVLVEAGGEGSNVAAPIAKKIFEEWFSR